MEGDRAPISVVGARPLAVKNPEVGGDGPETPHLRSGKLVALFKFPQEVRTRETQEIRLWKIRTRRLRAIARLGQPHD